MTTRTELEAAISWVELTLGGRNTTVGDNHLRVLRDASEAQLASMPPGPVYKLRVWDDASYFEIGYSTRAAASLEASNALTRGATKVEIIPCV